MQVRDVMTRDPATIGPDATLGAARALMETEGIRHLPVVSGDDALVGILTDRDVRAAAFAPPDPDHLPAVLRPGVRTVRQVLQTLPVTAAMTRAVVTTRPDATLAEAASAMLAGRFGSLPVVEAGRLVGILTERDLLRTLARLEAEPLPEFERRFLW